MTGVALSKQQRLHVEHRAQGEGAEGEGGGVTGHVERGLAWQFNTQERPLQSVTFVTMVCCNNWTSRGVLRRGIWRSWMALVMKEHTLNNMHFTKRRPVNVGDCIWVGLGHCFFYL